MRERIQTTTQRGYGQTHMINRRRLLMHLKDGELCWWCGRPMTRDQALDADHVEASSKGGRQAGRLLHSRCNRQRGNGDNDHRRPALHQPDSMRMLPIMLKTGGDQPDTPTRILDRFPWRGFENTPQTA